MTDLPLTSQWGIMRTDLLEFITEEDEPAADIPDLVRQYLEAWDDPNEEAPHLLICRYEPKGS